MFQVVTGLGETGNALCTAAVDKLAFTGSGATGKKVMAACAENLTPVIIEAGGKDSLIVDEDADLTKAAEAALWGGMANAGQTCIGTERVYVHEKVFDAFMAEITSQAKGLHAGPDQARSARSRCRRSSASSRATSTMPIAKGANVVLGGADAVGERFVQPTILTHVPEDSTEITDETFGPTLAINPVASMDEAVELTNATKYGLAGAVFAKRNGVAIARRVRSGMTSVNSVMAFAGVPAYRSAAWAVGLRPHPRRRRSQGVHLRQGDHPAEVQADHDADVICARRQDRRQGRADDDGPARWQADAEVGANE